MMVLMKLINWNFCGIYIQHRLYFSERCGFWKIISCIIKCRIYSDIDFRCFKPKENYTRSELLAWKFSILQSKENVSLSTLIWLSDAVHTLLICRSIISYLNFQDLCAEEEAALLIHMGIIWQNLSGIKKLSFTQNLIWICLPPAKWSMMQSDIMPVRMYLN